MSWKFFSPFFLIIPIGVVLFVVPTATVVADATITLTGCREITTSGSFVMNDALTTSDGVSCFNIHDTNAVFIDCQGNTVNDFYQAFSLSNVNNFSIKNCHFKTKNDEQRHRTFMQVTRSSRGDIGNNTLETSSPNAYIDMHIGISSFIKIHDNTFNGVIAFDQSTDNEIRSNTLTFNTTMTGIDALIDLKNGQRNSIIGNTLRGTEGSPVFGVGVDDGIVLVDESNDLVQGNSMTGNYDCGIETAGLISNTVIDRNTIQNSPICGIGGWYFNSWKNNTISNNTVDGSAKLFFLFRAYRLKPSEHAVYFTDNIFTGNSFSSSSPGDFNTEIDFTAVVQGNIPPDGRDISSTDFVLRNNTFQNNNFGTSGNGLLFAPANAIVDGGGNSCPIGKISNPLHCTNANPVEARPSTSSVSSAPAVRSVTRDIETFFDPGDVSALVQSLGLTLSASGYQAALNHVEADTRAFGLTSTSDQARAMANFITYGISSDTIRLGAGERRALLRDYLQTVQSTDVAWSDVQRLATGQIPLKRNITSERSQASHALIGFKKIFGHQPNFQKPVENLAWNTLLYRIRFSRDLVKESRGLKAYNALYHHPPKIPFDWAMVRVLGYVQ